MKKSTVSGKVLLVFSTIMMLHVRCSIISLPLRCNAGTASSFISNSRREFHKARPLYLNRFLLDPTELDDGIDPSSSPSVTLSKDDYRTIHAAKVLKLQNGNTLRAGIVISADRSHDPITNDESHPKEDWAGYVTDTASIEWLPEGKIKKAEPTRNGKPPGSLRIKLEGLIRPGSGEAEGPEGADISCPPPPTNVSLILALPRPLALGRLLPMIAQMGVNNLVLIGAQKVPKDYWGSDLFRKPIKVRNLLIEGLCQAGDVVIPTITFAKRFRPFVEDDLDEMFPADEWARVIAHPLRKEEDDFRLSDVVFPENEQGSTSRKIVLAVGPEGGWAEPYELDKFQDAGFQQITIGKRILRSDVAVISLLSLANDLCAR